MLSLLAARYQQILRNHCLLHQGSAELIIAILDPCETFGKQLLRWGLREFFSVSELC